MTEEQVKTVSELYKEKSNIYSDLEKLISDVYRFSLGYNSRCPSMYGATTLNSISSEFREEIKKLTIAHLQNRIQEIDKQLSKM